MRKLILFFFFLSGACGLVYEVLWGKYLSLFIGSTTYAHMIVLATFMGGLAAGGYVFGRVADRASSPLKLYAWLEIGIGLYGVLYPQILERLKDLYFETAVGFQFVGFMNILSKLPLSFLTMILPTFMMGGTLPVLSKFVVRSLARVGRNVASLYFINSFGAVVGTLIAGFYLIEGLGLNGAMLLTGVINLVLGAGALILVMIPWKPATKEDDKTEAIVTYETKLVQWSIAAIFLSGFTSMIYELVWIRLFAVVLESSTYSFSLMLAAFISGLTLGGFIVSRIATSARRFLFLLGLCELAITITIVAGVPFYERLPYYFWKLRYIFKPIPETFLYYHIVKFTLCFAIMFIPTLFFGMSLPLVSKIVSDDLSQLGKRIGNVYAVNTAGTLLGALTTGLVFIPLLGLKRSLEIGFVLNFLIAAITLWRSTDVGSMTWRAAPSVFGLLVLVLYFSLAPAWNKAHFATGFFRQRDVPPATYSGFKDLANESRVLYYKEDVSNNVAVLRTRPIEGVSNLILTVNGKADASSHADMGTQLLLGQLPLLLKKRADDVLIVGLGSGATAGTVLTHPVSRLDCVEISPAVAEAANYFSAYNHNVLNNPRFRLILEDAKTYVRITPKSYDVIISEPSNPWMAGVGNLFSLEFFQEAAKKLKPDGIVVQWFHNYEMTNDILVTVLKTFNVVFPYAYVFQGNKSDLIILGSRTEIRPDFQTVEEKLRNEKLKAELEKITVFDLPSLLALQMLSPDKVREVASGSPINRDYHPVLEYRAPLAFYLAQSADLVNKNDERFGRGDDLFISQYMNENKLSAENYKNMIRLFRNGGIKNERLAYSVYDKYTKLQPDDRDAMLEFSSRSFLQGRQELALSLLGDRLNEHSNGLSFLERYADLKYIYQLPLNSIFNPQDFNDVIAYLRKSLSQSKEKEKYLVKLGQVLFTKGLYREALNHFLSALELTERSSMANSSAHTPDDTLYLLIGKTYYRLLEYENAKNYLRRSLQVNPRNPETAYYFLAAMEFQNAPYRK